MNLLVPFSGSKLRIVASLFALACVIAPAAAEAKGRRQESAPAAQQTQPAAQDTQNTTQNTTPPLPEPQTPASELTAPAPLIQFQDVPEVRIGVDPNNVSRLTLHDAVVMAITKNIGIEVSRFDVETAKYNLFAAEGAYDTTLSGEVSFFSATQPVTSIFGGGTQDASRNTKQLVYNAGVDRLFRSGGSIAANFNNSRTQTNSTAQLLNPVYEPSLGVTFTQPLLRNLSFDATRRQIELAKRQLDLSDAQFRQKVIDVITQVQNSYWDLVYALRNEQIARESVQLARVQLENNLKQVEAGTLAPIELRSTESDLEARKESVIAALQQISLAENSLKNQIIGDPGSPMWSARIVPVDPADLVPVNTDLPSATKAALLNRPELEQLKLQTSLREIDRRYFKNQLKPQVDLFASYQTVGTAGGSDVTVSSGGSAGLDPFSAALVQSLNQVRRDAGLPRFDPTPFVNTDTGSAILVPDRFIGGYGRSLATLFSNDFRTYQVGVRFSFPVHNTVAEANYGRTLAELRQLDAQQRQLVQSIQVEVRNALQAVDAARQRYEAARASRIAAEAQLRGEEERFRAGLSTNFFVLDRQNQLSAAQGREAQALTDYNKAIVELQRVTGTTMVANNVQVDSSSNQ